MDIKSKNTPCILLKHRNFYLYAFFGVVSLFIDCFVYVVLYRLNIVQEPAIASLAGNICGFMFTFFTNTFLNFKKQDKLFKRFISYTIICIIGWGLSSIIIFVLKKAINPYILKFCTVFLIGLIQFILNKFITYRD